MSANENGPQWGLGTVSVLDLEADETPDTQGSARTVVEP